MSIQFMRAERRKAKLRIALAGAAGSGKSLSALYLAKGLVGGDMAKVVVVDTERSSAHMYADVDGLQGYSVVEFAPPYHPDRYIEILHACQKAGFDCIILDSITHEWDGEGGCLEIQDTIAKTMKDKWSAWAKVTPLHRRFVDTMLGANAHIIATMRKKVDYERSVVNGKSKIEKVGLKEIQREGMDYEFTIMFDVWEDHTATVSKNRTRSLQHWTAQPLSPAVGDTLREEAESGAEVAQIKAPTLTEKIGQAQAISELNALYKTLPRAEAEAYKNAFTERKRELGVQGSTELPPPQS